MIKIRDGEDLLNEIINGSSTAIEEFYDHYCGLVFGIAMKILKNKSDAEDLCHDVFIEIFKNPYSFDRKRGSVEAWIAIKTKNRAIDRLKRNKRFGYKAEEAIIETLSDDHSVENEVLLKTDREMIYKALHNLSKPQREVILGNFFKGYSHRELAEKLNRPLGTIKSLVRYGMNNLRKYFEEKNGITKARGEKNDM